jgi:Tfp pilus assembly protein PilN
MEVLNLEKVSAKNKFVQTFLDNRMESLDVVNELYKSVPKEIYLTSIAMEDNGAVSVQGISDVRSIIFKFGTTLKEKGFFKRVDVKSTTDKKDRDKDVSAFEIIVTLKTAPETEDEGGTKL